MSLKNGMQLVFLTAFSCVLFYRTTCLPAGPTYLSRSRTVDADADGDMNESPSVHNMEDFKLIYSITNIPRSARHADGLFTSGYSKLLGQLSAKDYLESLIAKRLSMDLAEEQLPVKRHSDAVFTDNYSRLRKEMAVKKYLNSVLSGKRSFENPSSIQNEASSQQTGDDISIDELVNLLPLGSPSS